MFRKFIDDVNQIDDHVHALLIIGIGGVVAILGPKDIGELLITTGAALWHGKSS